MQKERSLSLRKKRACRKYNTFYYEAPALQTLTKSNTDNNDLLSNKVKQPKDANLPYCNIKNSNNFSINFLEILT